MTDSNEQARPIFHAALSLVDRGQRADYLNVACRGDDLLRKQVASLLLAHEEAGEFMENAAVNSQQIDSPVADVPSQTIDRYKLLQQIGEGGFGVVYMAEQQRPVVRRVALKIVKAGMDTRQVIARFEAERQALAMMEHPNIAKVLDAGETDNGRPYFVMELVRGVSVVDYCDQQKLPNERRLVLFRDICGAIQHAHQKGIIHRDLKPSNILVTLHAGQPVPKVIDFGIAKATQTRLTDKTLFTRFEQFIGTPAYMSPEQAEMSGLDIDTRSDIYSLGVLLYELLTGQTPLDRKELTKAGFDEIRRRIRDVDPPTPSSRLSGLQRDTLTTVAANRQADPARMSALLQGDLDWIVIKAMDKDRSRRYETASALAEDVGRYLRQEPVSAVPPSSFYRFQKFARRNKAALATGAALAAILIAAVVVSSWQAIRASRQARLTVESERKARVNLYVAEMNVARDAIENGNIERAVQILRNHIPIRGERDLRGFEWGHLWQQSHRELFSIETEDSIHDVDISADGKMMVTAARNGQIRVWDWATRTERGSFRLDRGQYVWASFSPDGKWIAACSSEMREITLWDIERQSEIQRYQAGEAEGLRDVDFTPNGKKVYAGDGSGDDPLSSNGPSDTEGRLWIWDIQSRKAESFKQHQDMIWSASCSPDSNRFATASVDGAVKILNYETQESKELMPVGADAVQRVRFSPNGELVVTVPRLWAEVGIWNSSTGKGLQILEFPHEVVDARFSPNGKVLAVGEMAGRISLLSTESWERITTYHHHGHQLNKIAFSPNSNRIFSVGDNGKILMWPVQPPEQSDLLTFPVPVSSVTYSPNGALLGIGDSKGGIHVYDAESLHKKSVVPATDRSRSPPQRLRYDYFSFHPDNRRLARLTEQNKSVAEIWDLSSNELIRTITHGDETVTSVLHSPDGKLLATGAFPSGLIRLWDAETGVQVGPEMIEASYVVCLAFSPESNLLASEGWGDIGVNVWNVATGEKVANLKEHIEPAGDIGSIKFSPDGELLATAGYDRKVILWDTKTWRSRMELLGHSHMVTDLSFSPDGNRIASGAWDGWTKVWDTNTGHEVARFVGNALAFSCRGDALAVGGGGSNHLQTDTIRDKNGVASFKAGSPFTSVRLYRAKRDFPPSQ